MWGPWENVVCLFSSDPTDVAAETIQVPNCLLFTCTLLLVLFTWSIALVSPGLTVLFDVVMYLSLDYVPVDFELPVDVELPCVQLVIISLRLQLQVNLYSSLILLQALFIHLLQHIWKVSFSQAVCRLFGWAECVCWQQSCKARDVN